MLKSAIVKPTSSQISWHDRVAELGVSLALGHRTKLPTVNLALPSS